MKMKKKNITRKRLSGKYDNRKTRKQHKKYKNKTLKKMNRIVIVDGGRDHSAPFRSLVNAPGTLLYNAAVYGPSTVGKGLYNLGQATSSGVSSGFSYFTGNQQSPPLNAQNLQENQGQYQTPSSRSSTASDGSVRSSQSRASSHASIPSQFRQQPSPYRISSNYTPISSYREQAKNAQQENYARRYQEQFRAKKGIA